MDMKTELLRTLLIPLENSQVLLPSATVTEVLPYRQPTAGEGPEWVLGHINWGGKRIPVLSLETLFDGATPSHGSRTRLAVLNAVGDSDGLDHYAVVSQSVPRLVTLQAHMIEADEVALLPDGVLSKARLARRPVYIPDLDWIEAQLTVAVTPIAA
jgi:chemosensory pili system protein ChpC